MNQIYGLLTIGPDDSNARGDWTTPPLLLSEIEKRWGKTFDPCPYPRFEWDGLKIDWPETVFINPPYGSGVSAWFEKAIAEISSGRTKTAIFLVHARTDTKWFHEYILGGAQELWFIRGRVSFSRNGKTAPSPFPSIIAVFKAPPDRNELFAGSWGRANAL